MATTTTCTHGLDAGTCLICATLGTAPTVVPARGRAIPVGKADVLGAGSRPRRRHRLGVLGSLVVVLIVLIMLWWVVGIIWSLLRIAELVAVGAACGLVGYRIGLAVGRRQGRR